MSRTTASAADTADSLHGKATRERCQSLCGPRNGVAKPGSPRRIGRPAYRRHGCESDASHGGFPPPPATPLLAPCIGGRSARRRRMELTLQRPNRRAVLRGTFALGAIAFFAKGAFAEQLDRTP